MLFVLSQKAGVVKGLSAERVVCYNFFLVFLSSGCKLEQGEPH